MGADGTDQASSFSGVTQLGGGGRSEGSGSSSLGNYCLSEQKQVTGNPVVVFASPPCLRLGSTDRLFLDQYSEVQTTRVVVHFNPFFSKLG